MSRGAATQNRQLHSSNQELVTDSLLARARVLAADESGRLSVELLDAGRCRGCRCGRLTGGAARAIELALEKLPPLQPGDELTIAMPAREILIGAAWLHGLPWAGLLAGAAAGGLAGFGDLACLASSGAGLGAALLFLRQTRRRWSEYARSAMYSATHG